MRAGCQEAAEARQVLSIRFWRMGQGAPGGARNFLGLNEESLWCRFTGVLNVLSGGYKVYLREGGVERLVL